MPSHRRRQITLGGSLTFRTTASLVPSLVLDPNPTHTSLEPTYTSSASAAPSSNGTATSISTPAIIGLTLGVFACLAAALVVLMSVRHRRRIQAKGVQARGQD